MQTRIVEATTGSTGNWGKFLLARFDSEWEHVSSVSPWPSVGGQGWTDEQEHGALARGEVKHHEVEGRTRVSGTLVAIYTLQQAQARTIVLQSAFTETFRRYVRSPEESADASDVAIADALHDAEERVMAVLPPEQREREQEPGPDTCPTCGMPGYLVPGRGDNPDAFIPDER